MVPGSPSWELRFDLEKGWHLCPPAALTFLSLSGHDYLFNFIENEVFLFNPQMFETLNYLLHAILLNRRRQWQPTPVLLPGKSHGWRSLVGCSPWDCWRSDTTERLHFHFSISCIGEGNGTPLQCSCLENPRDRGACGLPSMGSHRVGHNWSDLVAAAAAYC